MSTADKNMPELRTHHAAFTAALATRAPAASRDRSRLVRLSVIVALIAVAVSDGRMLASQPATQQLAASDSLANDYAAHIKPLLRARCYSCHGSLKQRAGLRLDTVASILRGSESGAVVRPGDVAGSRLIARVTSSDPAERMPPEHEGDPLTPEQVAMLSRWVAAGAAAPADEQPEPDVRDHWSFRPVVRPTVPEYSGWGRNAIDAFIARQHADQALTPQTEAPRIVLLRRLYLDLIGIPPTHEEIAAFESDPSPDSYERTADRLLADPRHGERWARHWMDIWRYSDWWGFGDQLRNSQKHIWHWRDWIVESLNGDLPYDEMVRLMLAADELAPHDLDKLRATGYLARNWFLFNRNHWMEETVEHVSKGLLGLTMNCAKCHDHKYDPIEQADFFRMRAFFEPYHVRMDMVPGQADLAIDGIPRIYDGSLDPATHLFIRGDEKTPDTSRVIEPGVPAVFQFAPVEITPIALPMEAWQPERRDWVIDAYMKAAEASVKKAETELDAERRRFDEAKTKFSQAMAGSSPESSHDADSAIEQAQLQLCVAEAAVAVARSEFESVGLRASAMRATWCDEVCEAVRRESTAAAVRSERDVAVAKAKLAVAASELALARAEAGKKEAATAELDKAKKSLDEAEKNAVAPIAEDASFTRLSGASWTPTRFFNSGKDDPLIPFLPQSTGRRTALARWITDARHPLTARVAVNHIWTRHMTDPLVPTVFDFGRNGVPPVYPDLLDWLAAEFVENGWSMKHLHRLIVTSAAYRMSSSLRGGETNMAKDPDNRFLWRRTAVRLESQAVRDSILALAGTLDQKMGGAPIAPAQQAQSRRRSLYFFHSSNERNLFLATFDEALVRDCYRREQSIVPQQALALTHSGLVLDAAPQIAARLAQNVANDEEFIRKSFAVVVGIEASDDEVAAAKRAIAAWRQLAGADQAARTNLIWALLNHNDFVTLR